MSTNACWERYDGGFPLYRTAVIVDYRVSCPGAGGAFNSNVMAKMMSHAGMTLLSHNGDNWFPPTQPSAPPLFLLHSHLLSLTFPTSYPLNPSKIVIPSSWLLAIGGKTSLLHLVLYPGVLTTLSFSRKFSIERYKSWQMACNVVAL